MNLSKHIEDKELFSVDNKENIMNENFQSENNINNNCISPEDIFSEFDKLNENDMYDVTIIDNYLESLEYIFFNVIEKNNKINELYKWKDIFLRFGYKKDSYIVQWIEYIYIKYIIEEYNNENDK
jgi:hypothetical protein